MKAFVNRIAENLAQNRGKWNDTVIIVPSERMINYLQKALFEVDHLPKISPKIITIDRWIQDLVRIPIINKTAALFELYQIFENDPIEHEIRSFDSFLNWGQLLLSDFDEIDRYLVDPKSLFKNLKDVKELESWSFNNEELSLGQQKFMAFWDKLGPYYFAFEARLKQLNLLTKGKAYRYAADELMRLQKENSNHYVFAGFNALSEAEISIFRQLKTLGKAQFFLDNDAYYLLDEMHEAGSFQRVFLNRLELKAPDDTLNVLSNKNLKIEVVECSQTTDQASVIATELLKLNAQERNETLVLLADEIQLKSLLHQLPASIEKANITLGLPLKSTAIKTWVELIFQFQDGIQQYGTSSMYFKQFSAFIHHPFLEATLPETELRMLYELESKSIQNNWQYIAKKNQLVGPITTQLIQLLQNPWSNDWIQALNAIQELNVFIDTHLQPKWDMEQTLVRCFSTSVQGLQNLMQRELLPEMNRSTFRNLFNQHWGSESIAYYGNPLDGIQIMGLLETRGLDFKNIFVLGLNEGVMPPDNPIQTLIPMDLRQYFGLPTPREKQGLFAHHFYRLLHSAEHMVVTYTGASDVMGSSEPSRFLKQIELELAKENPNIELEFKQVNSGNNERIENVVIAKTEEIYKRLDLLLERGISFSKLAQYLNCPLNFYYINLLGIGEENKLEEDLESGTQGQIIHFVLESLFSEFAERYDESGKLLPTKMVTIDDLKQMKLKIPLLVEKGFLDFFAEDPETWQRGVNYIQYEMVKELVECELNREIEILSENPEKALFIVSLEQKYESEIQVTVRGEKQKVRVNGVVDRIDRFGGRLRILDYKSGKVEQKDLKLTTKNLPDPLDYVLVNLRKNNKVHALQLLMYAFLIHRTTDKRIEEAGIISFINHRTSPVFVEADLSLENVEPLLQALIQEIIDELYDPAIPFAHNLTSKYCDYCS